MIDYKLYIDISGGKNPDGYFEINVINLGEMTSEYVDGNIRVERRGFGEIEVRNEPYKYIKLGGDKYNLYDIISSVSPNQEIHLKFVSAYETLYAYFGIIDCKLDADKNKITIKPYILDQYTDLLENSETEVKLFDETNQIVNGDFKQWSGSNPIAWNKNTPETVYERFYFNDNSSIKILPVKDVVSTYHGVNQQINNVLKGSQISISFLWALLGTSSKRHDLYFKCYLVGDSNSYDLNENGKWVEYNETKQYVYKPQALPIDANTAQFNTFSKLSESIPENGYIKLYIYHDYYEEILGFNFNYSELVISNVVLSVSAIKLNTIRIQLNSENLVTETEDSYKIFWLKRNPKADFYSTKFDYQKTLDSFFDGNGKPIESELIMSDKNGIQIRDIIQFFQEQQSISYKFELSKITIFKCEYIAHKKRRFRAICEFSREEVYLDEADTSLNDTEWFNTGLKESPNSKRVLWVRTPFNDAEISWTKSAINTSNWRQYNGTFGYYDSIESVKQYPIIADSDIEILNAIDLREIFRKVYTETHISLRGKNVYSNFLWNDTLSAEEEALVYLNNDTSTNYVTLTDSTTDVETKNELNNIVGVHTYEFSTEATTDDEKTILKTTFKDLMSDFLARYPQCYWFIDADGHLHIEHIKYFDRVNVAKDITGTQYNYLGEYQSWEYIKDKLFSLEKYSFKNSANPDFATSEVTFDKIVSNKRGQDVKNEISGSIITTDVKYCLENRNSLDNGIVLLAYNVVDGENICRYGLGQKTHKSVINGDLSIASLLAKYATYEGVWQEGKINGLGFWNDSDTYKFTTTKPTRQGEEITIRGAFLNKVILSKLGIGIVSQRKIDYENSITKIVAMYRHSDNYLVMSDDNLIDYGGSIPVEITIPDVSTISTATELSISTAKCSGIINSDGNDTIIESGIIYSLEYETTTYEDGIIETYGAIIGGFNVQLVSLNSLTLYYYRAYAINGQGIAYGNIYTFNTL